MVYQLLVLFLLLISIFHYLIKQYVGYSWSHRKIFLIPIFIFLFSIMGFRSVYVGVDTYTYSMMYNWVSNESFITLFADYFYDSIEIGYCLLAKVSSFVIDDYYFFQITVSFLFLFFIYKFILDNSNRFITASIIFISIGIYLSAFNITRQMLAVSIVANIYTYLRRNKPQKAFLLTLIALTIHVSSIISIFIYVIYYFKENKKMIFCILLSLCIFCLFFENAINIISNYFPVYSNYYSNQKQIQEANMVKVLWAIEFLMSIYILYRKRIFNSDKRFIAVMCLIYVVSNWIGLSFNYFERIGLYFSPFLILLFESYGDSLKRRSLRFSYYAILNCCFMIYFLKSSSSGQYIYSSFLNF